MANCWSNFDKLSEGHGRKFIKMAMTRMAIKFRFTILKVSLAKFLMSKLKMVGVNFERMGGKIE